MVVRAIFTLLICLLIANVGYSKFPERPITIIVYTKPGGAIDVFARKFQSVVKKYSDATFVVVNRPGAGGIVALKSLLKARPDGYTIGAVTKSNIGKIVSSNSKISLNKFHWMALLVSDPEAIIVNKTKEINSWDKIVEDAKKKNGEQIWVGPATGGNDHVMAIKTWEKSGITAKWIPYAGGAKSMLALLGGHGVAYVGNPSDVIGKPDLKVAAVSSFERLEGRFADVPTFKELGVSGLDNEIMWRGFTARSGIPNEAKKYFNDLFNKIIKDSEWNSYISRGGATPMFKGEKEFFKIVKEDYKDFIWARNRSVSKIENLSIVVSVISLLVMITLLLLWWKKRDKLIGIMIPVVFIAFAGLLIFMSNYFSKEASGPATIPLLWGTFLIIMSSILIVVNLRGEDCDPKFGDLKKLFAIIGSLLGYLLLIPTIGFYLSSAIFILLVMTLLKYEKKWVIGLMVLGWPLISYFIFCRLLYIQLPVGDLWN